ncbi:hypothetical protein [Streptosporangium sp. NPDC087985]|uniref:hypothetical protein n=1 Tax=Streptosporangium sp. NPDC087985 TaxID=3366196 RepID=UPI0038025F4D
MVAGGELRAGALLLISAVVAVVAIGRVLSAETPIDGGDFAIGAVVGAAGARPPSCS